MKNKIFILVVCGLMITLFLFSPIKLLLCNLGVMSITKIGNEFNPQLREDDSWYTPIYNAIETAKATLNDLYCNYLPHYNDLVAFHGNVEQSLNEPVYTLLDHYGSPAITPPAVTPSVDTLEGESAGENAETETPVSERTPEETIVSFKSRFISQDATHRYYMFTVEYGDGTEKKALERVALYEPEVLKKRMESMQNEMVRITKYLSTQTNVYVFSGSRFQDSPVLNDYLPTEYSTEADRDAFLEALSPYAKTAYLHLDSLEDRFEKMYLTDHHWNEYGMHEGYAAVHSMIKENWPEISDLREPTHVTIDGVKFYGSFARLSNHYSIYDGFSYFEYNLPKHTTTGGSLEDQKPNYLAGRYDNSRGANHYGIFYPKPTRVVYSDNNTDRNLLIVGDSFSRGFIEYIGSHFDSTTVRPYWQSSELDLEKAIKRYGITDVVFLIYSDRFMYNLYEDFNLSLLKTPADY